MALSESAIDELLNAIDAGDGTDLIRDLVRWLVQELIEAEAAAAIGAGHYERTGERLTHRNGHRLRVWSTKAGAALPVNGEPPRHDPQGAHRDGRCGAPVDLPPSQHRRGRRPLGRSHRHLRWARLHQSRRIHATGQDRRVGVQHYSLNSTNPAIPNPKPHSRPHTEHPRAHQNPTTPLSVILLGQRRG